MGQWVLISEGPYKALARRATNDGQSIAMPAMLNSRNNLRSSGADINLDRSLGYVPFVCRDRMLIEFYGQRRRKASIGKTS